MLDGTGDTQRDVQLRRHGLTGLTHLELTRVVPGVHRGTRGTDSGTQRIGELLDDAELLGATDTTTAGHDDAGLGELRTVSTDHRLTRGHLGGVLGRRGHLNGNLLARTGGRRGLDGTRTHGDDRGVAVGLSLDGERATEDRVQGLAALTHLDDIGQQARAQACGQASGHLLALGGRGDQDAGGAGGLGQAGQQVDLGGHQVIVDDVGLGDVDLGGAGLLETVDQRRGGTCRTGHHGRGLAQNAGGGDEFGAYLLERTL